MRSGKRLSFIPEDGREREEVWRSDGDEKDVAMMDVGEEGDSEECVFPLIEEPLNTFVTVNPATLEDEELWPLSSLKSLCEYVGLSVKGNRRSILNRLQTWNGAPLSGAGHPDLFETRPARFHTVPMAFVRKEALRRESLVEPSNPKDSDDLETLPARTFDTLAGASASSTDMADHSDFGVSISSGANSSSSCSSPEIIERTGALTWSTPNTSFGREIKSCLSTSTPRKGHLRESKSAGRICFSPYNYVRVFPANPGERELNIDPDSILRLAGGDYDLDESRGGGVTYFTGIQDEDEDPSVAGEVSPDTLVSSGGGDQDLENSDRNNVWAGSGCILVSKNEWGR